MNHFLAHCLLASLLPGATPAPHSGPSGNWVNVQGPGIKARDVLHFGPGKSFTVKIQESGQPPKVVTGTVRTTPPDATARHAHVSQILFLMIDANAGAELGMPVGEQKVIRRRRDHLAMMSRLFYIPGLPALTDMGNALFVRKGSEASVSHRFAAMRKKLKF